MAKLPDYIDKTDKKAVAEYFIKQREIKEETEYWLNAIEKDSRGYTTIIADFESYESKTLKFLRENGFNPVKIEHLTWMITKPLDGSSDHDKV